MPRQKSWIPRIAEILQHLESDLAPDYVRIDIERIFKLGADQATHLMEVAGYCEPPRQGIAGRTSRPALLSYVQNCREGQDALRELERRRKLAKKLEVAKEDLKLRNVVLRVNRQGAEWSSFSDIPNVSITPGLMQVAFTPGDSIELLGTLYRFIKAVGNEEEEFRKMCEGSDSVPRTEPLFPEAGLSLSSTELETGTSI